jgi:hypothetical protein
MTIERAATVQEVEAGHADAARLRRLAGLVATLGILALNIYLHSYRLAATPGWDAQEGYNLDLAWNLAHGHLRLFALRSAFAQHPPLFYFQLALAIRLAGYGVFALRALTGLYAVLTCAALLGLARRLVGAGPALWTGLVFTVAPVMLANTRWGYTYAQLMLVGVLCLWAVWCHLQEGKRRWLLLAAMLAGLAAVSDYEGIALVPVVILVALRRGKRETLIGAGISLGIPMVGLLLCFLAAPDVFLADVAATLGRAAGGNLAVQLVALLVNYYRFLSLDVWLLLGVVGLFLLPQPRARAFLLGAVAALALVTLKVRDLGTSLHVLVPLLPLLALGAGIALDLAVRRLYGWGLEWLGAALPMRRTNTEERVAENAQRRTVRLAAALGVFVVVVSPVGLATASDLAGLATTFSTRQDGTLATPDDAGRTATYVFAQARDGDLVLASPEIAWMFDAPETRRAQVRGADLLQTVAQGGQAAAFYSAGLPPSRWEYDVSLGRARYVVVDDLLRRLAAPDQVPTLVPMLGEVERWPVVFTCGQYTVYEQPTAA